MARQATRTVLRFLIAGVVVALVIVSSTGALTLARGYVHPSSRPAIFTGAFTSENWSGYAVTGPTGSVTDVKGSWVVHTVICSSVASYSAFWVGIDGFSSSTVEQTGTDSDCQGGAPTYYAWYEFYPYPSYYASLTVRPGDVISAQVSAVGKWFTVSIADLTTDGTFSMSQGETQAKMSSAEWIAEGSSSGSGILPLANFGSVSFGGDFTGVSSTDYATVSGVTGSIASFGNSNVQTITMVTSGGSTEALPSQLSPDGTSFTIAYEGPGATSSSSTTSTSSMTSSTTGSSSSSTTSSTTSSTSTSSTSSTSSKSSTTSSTTSSSTTSSSFTSTTTSTTSSSSTSKSTPTLVVSVSTDGSSFALGAPVQATAVVTSSATGLAVPYPVVSIVLTLSNGARVTGTAYGTISGIAKTTLIIPAHAALGTATIVATATAAVYVSGSGSATITVT